jgi:hypothetical protein
MCAFTIPSEFTCIMHSRMALAEAWALCTVQAVQRMGLQHLEVATIRPGAATVGGGITDFIAPFLSTSLTSLATYQSLAMTADSVMRTLATQLPLLRSLDCAAHISLSPSGHVADALAALAQQAPQLTSLCFRSRDGPSRDASNVQLGMPHPMALSQLSNLQRLIIANKQLASCLAPALCTLPALTRLELTYGIDKSVAHYLAALTRLRSLRLGRCIIREEYWEAMQAATQMDSLTELVMGQSLLTVDEGLFAGLLPPPSQLRRLVVTSQAMWQVAWQVLGLCVQDICLEDASEQTDESGASK